ncbi:LacI family DNA-binding transcriptional regulator [Anaerolineales bacterium]
MSLEKIAKIAGVSKSTVSRVINDDINVSEKTRALVKKVIEEVGYNPNSAARSLVTKRTQTIGVAIPNAISILFDTSFYFPTILRGISKTTSERHYATLLFIGESGEDDLRFSRRIMHRKMMDGIIIVSPTLGHPLFDELIQSGTPFISADRVVHPRQNINYITVENIESSRKAVNHLIQQNRSRVAMLAGNPNIIDTLDRIEGYKLALADHQIPFDPDLLMVEEYSYEFGYQSIQSLIDKGIDFDSVYASQSTLAVGAVNALMDNHISLPDQVSLIAFDDLADAMNPRIRISTMHQPVFEKGALLASTLIDLIEGKIEPPIQRFLPTELIVRDTCGA